MFARPEYQWARDELAELLTEQELAAARAATLNAHFTDAALVQQVWRAVTELGFDCGQVLEPGCGTGNFIGFAPPQAQITGVELDPVTAEIAGWLYPQATIRVESFAKTRVVHGTFDAVIGNVPFGKYVEHDPVYNPDRFTIHNAFLYKAVQLTRPGGLVAVLTSRYTMDATDTTVRDRLFAFADLVGAVRLPSGAHRKAAGTDVVTDLLILRRREPDHTPAADSWLHTTPVEVDAAPIPINRYFVEHPELVLGELTAEAGQYGETDLAVNGPADASLLLAEAIDRIVTGARAQQLTWTPPPAQAAPVAFLDPHATVPDRYLRAHRDGTFTQVVYGTEQPFEVPDGQGAELRALLGLRDTVVELLDAEAHTEHTTGHIDTLRRRLNQRYDAYHARYGPINRTTATKTGAARRPNQGGFRKDPYAVLVQALEIYDPDTGTAAKAEIFRQRVEQPRRTVTRTDTPADALAICMDRHGELRLPVIAELLGMDQRAARQALGTLVFDDPDTGTLVLADQYLSGNVRAKHARAVKAAATDPRYGPNVTALAEVIPTDIPPQEIHAQLGASWIDATHVQQFLRETLSDPQLKVDHPGGSTWKVVSWRRSLEAVEQWGTPDAPAPALAEALLRRKPIEVRRTAADGSTYLDTEATAVAAAKASELDERFGEWLWEDPARAAELARKYNHEFNATRLREYAGSYLTFPGLAHGFSPRGHQNAGVERILLNPAVGLFHEVGAGKTSVMIIAAREMRRLGLVTKPVIVTPKNVLQPFVAEFLERYPRARLLVGYAEDITPDQRRAFIARAATTSWDAVLMTRDAFERIPMDYASRLAYLNRAVDEVTATASLAEGMDWDEATVKELERAKKRAEERVERLMDKARDDGIDFKQTLIDYVFADEAAANQGYKNLMTLSAMPGMSIAPGSGRALDMHMKLEYLRAHYPRVATLATATPITRSLAEIYNWMRYLDPQALHQRAITTFDQFLATFTTTSTDFELTVTGALKLKTRVNRIVNIPELIGMFRAVGDIQTAEDLQLPTPLLKARPDGKRRPQVITVAQGPHGHDYQQHLERRADALGGRPEKGGDNHLLIVNDGKAAAVDLRLVGRSPDRPSKLTTVADTIARVWQETKDNEYLTRTGQPSPHLGALQIVFCDLGVPSDGRAKTGTFVVYHELRDQLAARGIPREKIRYAHEAGNDERKRAALVDDCNNGKVAVLIASTGKGGQGNNWQARLIALHHVDCTWNPSDLLQRDGRIKRQGNQNPEIYIFNYVAEGSFDGYVYQTVERKARLIGPVLSGKVTDREIEDVGEVALSLAEVKALASGNPLLLELNQAERDLARLERLERNHTNGQRTIRYTITSREQDAQIYQTAADEYAHALTLRKPTRGDAFTITIGQQTYRRRRDAEQALHELVASLDPGIQDQPVGTLGGLTLIASTTPQADPADRRVVLAFAEATRSRVALFANGTDLGKPVNIVARLENRLDELDAEQANYTMLADQAAAEAERAKAQLGRQFRYTDELAAARDRFTDLKARLAAQQKHTSPGGDGAAPGPAAPAPVAAPATTGYRHPAAPPVDSTPAVHRFGDGWRGQLDPVLQVAVALTELRGFTSKKDAEAARAAGGDLESTATLTQRALTGTAPADERLRDEIADRLTGATAARAALIKRWAQALPEAGDDFLRQLAHVAAGTQIDPRQLATLVAAVPAHARHEQQQAHTATAAHSAWQGTQRQRLTTPEVTVLAITRARTRTGLAVTATLADQSGNLYTWQATQPVPIAVGDRGQLHATVTAHRYAAASRETVLSRGTWTPATPPTDNSGPSSGIPHQPAAPPAGARPSPRQPTHAINRAPEPTADQATARGRITSPYLSTRPASQHPYDINNIARRLDTYARMPLDQARAMPEVIADLAAITARNHLPAVVDSGARYLLGLYQGGLDHLTTAQRQAILTASRLPGGDPERITAYAALTPDQFHQLDQPYRTAITSDLQYHVEAVRYVRHRANDGPSPIDQARTLLAAFTKAPEPPPNNGQPQPTPTATDPDQHDHPSATDPPATGPASGAAAEPPTAATPDFTSTAEHDAAADRPGELSPVGRNALAHARNTHASSAARLVAYLQVPTEEANRLPLVRDDLRRIADAGTVAERSTAEHLLDRLTGRADHLSDAQREAIVAASAAFPDPPPAARVGRYRTLDPQQFAQLPDIHREAIIADLRELASSNTPARARPGTPGITYRGGLAPWIHQAKTLLTSLTAADPAPASPTGPATAATPQPPPAPEPAGRGGLVIEHGPHGTVVRGTSRHDQTLHKLLGDHDFKWSQRKEFWYLPRPWKLSTRTDKVHRLTQALDNQGRTYQVHETSTGDTQQTPASVVLPAAEPYRNRREVQTDYQKMAKAWTTLYANQTAKTMMHAHTRDSRPDGRALADAMRTLWEIWSADGQAAEAVTALTEAAGAARTLLTNLTTQRHRAPKLLPQLETFTTHLERFAARMAATAARRHGSPLSDTSQPIPEAGRPGPAETQRRRRGHDFYPAPAANIPELGATRRQQPADIILYEHYFVGGMDWWIAEWDPTTGHAFGYACLGDPTNAEWGMVDLTELEQITVQGLWVVERDLHWHPVPAGQAALPGHHAPTPPPAAGPTAEPAPDATPAGQHQAADQPAQSGRPQPPNRQQPHDARPDPAAGRPPSGSDARPRPGPAAAHVTPPGAAAGTPTRPAAGQPLPASRWPARGPRR